MTPFAGSQPTDSITSPLAGRLFVVTGAGGAGKALAYGAKEKGAKVVIANRTFGICFFMMILLNKFNHISAYLHDRNPHLQCLGCNLISNLFIALNTDNS